jgi:hypothetical protein
MRKTMLATAFVLITLVWAAAQQPASEPERSGGQATSPSSQAPNAGQQQEPATPGGTGQNAPHTGAQTEVPGQVANAPITEGCLGGSNPNYTITDSAGKTYKLNLPPNADASVLTPYVGQSVQVMGDINSSTNSIDASKMARGMGKCPASSTGGAPPPPKQ